jgi:hypothetical protein
MATVTALDYRKTDLRKNVLFNPYWISSNEVIGDDAEDLASILFSFPASQGTVLVHEICVQITTVFTVDAGAAVGTLGVGTLATDAVTTGGDVTTVDVDDYIVTADITFGTAGYYWPTNGSDFLTAKAAGTISGPVVIVGADATVPAIVIYLSNAGGVISTGKCKVHALISHLPGGAW